MTNATATALPAELTFEGIRYSRVWEDHAVLEAGLDVGPDDDVLSICSAGDNVLALALQGPRSILAIDLNPAQAALLQLHMAAIRSLEHAEYARLLGATPGDDRLALYERARPALPAAAAAYWDTQASLLEAGVVRCGRLDLYFWLFQHEHLAKLFAPETIEALWSFDDLAEQAAYFERELATPEFEALVTWYFGREMMEKSGRDPAQFAFVDIDDVGRHFWRRLHHTCTTMLLKQNHYMRLAFTSEYGDLELGPAHLRPGNFEALRASLDRIEVEVTDVATALRARPPGTFSKANLSDIFEYLPEETTEALMRLLGGQLRPGGRMAWWCLLVPRPLPPSLGEAFRSHDTEAEKLWQADRAWFYRSFHVAEATGEAVPE